MHKGTKGARCRLLEDTRECACGGSWWQVLFLLYHYFNAREIYNAIRVFIAGYVWMTGYGNFMYYYHYKDFCLGRCAACASRMRSPFLWCLSLKHCYRQGSCPGASAGISCTVQAL